MGAKADTGETALIGFPVKCEYKGGHTVLGRHGKHFRIEGGNIGYGEFGLSHGIPLDEVTSVEVSEQEFGGSERQTLVGLGTMNVGGMGRHGSPGSEPKQVTLITVRTKDDQAPVWEVDHRGAEWVRERLGPALRHASIPFYEDLPPSERPK
jgi:hypothetical protein